VRKRDRSSVIVIIEAGGWFLPDRGGGGGWGRWVCELIGFISDTKKPARRLASL